MTAFQVFSHQILICNSREENNQYTGKYLSQNKTLPDVVIFTEQNKLFWKFNNEDAIITELIPKSKTEYFMVEDQRVLFTFKKESENMSIVVVPQDKKEYLFFKEK